MIACAPKLRKTQTTAPAIWATTKIRWTLGTTESYFGPLLRVSNPEDTAKVVPYPETSEPGQTGVLIETLLFQSTACTGEAILRVFAPPINH